MPLATDGGNAKKFPGKSAKALGTSGKIPGYADESNSI
jgi:hypothetical protein